MTNTASLNVKALKAVNLFASKESTRYYLNGVLVIARTNYCDRSSDNIEIDIDAEVSHGDEGAWVQAWVFVNKAEYAGLIA